MTIVVMKVAYRKKEQHFYKDDPLDCHNIAKFYTEFTENPSFFVIVGILTIYEKKGSIS